MVEAKAVCQLNHSWVENSRCFAAVEEAAPSFHPFDDVVVGFVVVVVVVVVVVDLVIVVVVVESLV